MILIAILVSWLNWGTVGFKFYSSETSLNQSKIPFTVTSQINSCKIYIINKAWTSEDERLLKIYTDYSIFNMKICAGSFEEK